MADHSENFLRAVIKSLRDVVGPAVDAGDPMAQEQLALSISTLEFLQSRLPRLHARAVFELEHHLRLAKDVLAELRGAEAAQDLAKSVEYGDQVIAVPGVDDSVLTRATAAIAANLRALLDADIEESARARAERTIIAAMAERITFERAWYLPMGFDPSPLSAPALDDVLPVHAG
ncbi:hypothetical protein CJ179_15430 [Rhodococcus sp. ACS1]|uniref:hypothetical protein n=1 Tax=Rhodococcus sp. ACS1 TaxID=2028570 RepID=UPI000BB165B8|nr:hypothetical protein [Rhodococcus sp. ACS1]PBC48242.1 hypothetical protein CJ179_15430 [Rhodococcus sp. ACS1]